MNDLICGVDEAGRGPLAGPVYAAAVILDPARPIEGLADSKKLSEKKRERLALEIRAKALAFGIASASVEEIDAINILQATLLAMRRAIAALPLRPTQVLIDGNRCPSLDMPARAIVGGDALEPVISAASILAKTARDADMRRLHEDYPQYALDRHKGYDTAAHRAALAMFGPAHFHRKSFAPVRALLQKLERLSCRMTINGPRTITSRANPGFKALRALADDPRAPRREGRALVDGVHLVATCLARGVRIRQILFSESGWPHPEIAGLREQARGIDSLVFSDALFREIVGVMTPTGIAAVIEIPAAPPEGLESSCTGDAVLLDAVQDAGNVGAILRTAAAASVRDIVLGIGCAGVWTPRVLRAGQGAHFSLRIREQVDLTEMLEAHRGTGITTVATVAHAGENLYALDLRQPVVWLFGNEGAGLAPALIAAAHHRVTIPLAATSESLNVAAAAAVCLFEAVRQRKSQEGTKTKRRL